MAEINLAPLSRLSRISFSWSISMTCPIPVERNVASRHFDRERVVRSVAEPLHDFACFPAVPFLDHP